MLIRLLQSFSSFSLDETAFTAEGRAPADWASSPGRKGIDKFRPRAHLTMYSTVSRWISRHRRDFECVVPGWNVDPGHRGCQCGGRVKCSSLNGHFRRIGYAEYILYMYNIEWKIPKSCSTLNSLTNTNQRRLQRSP
jgi:hypothetical protein